MDPRSDSAMARIVQRGVELCASQGRHAAESYFQRWQVPQHVALRVLACAAFRRKPDAGAPLSLRCNNHLTG